MLRPMGEVVREAVDAAANIRSSAVSMRAAQALSVRELVNYVNGLQLSFERVSPLASFTSDEVQAAAVSLYGSRAPANALALLGAAQVAGAAVITAIVGQVLGPTPQSWSWDADAGVYRERALAGQDLTAMHAALDGLVTALGPVGG